MSDQARAPAERLREITALLEQEWGGLQIVGRALTPQEQQRLERLGRALPPLREAQSHLEGTGPGTEPGFPESGVSEGRYEGGNAEIFVELRIDESGSGVISADIYRTARGERTYDASLRTAPGVRISRSAGAWGIVGTDRLERRATGRLVVAPTGGGSGSLTCTLILNEAVGTLPVRTEIHFTASHVSSLLRPLGLELEREETVAPLPSFSSADGEVSMESALRKAGFEITDVGELTRIPEPLQPWGNAQLHTLMEDLAQAPLSRPAWELHLLALSRPSRERLLGIMFDTGVPLPRQGSAVFCEEIRRLVAPEHFPRKVLQTTVHELGHALNLAHRFERAVGRADSTSFMNYDWRYKGGGHAAEFWRRFDFSFDRDELEFLRHAPRWAVVPGGARFHSVNYWAEGTGGYSPYVPEVPTSILELTLRPPAAGTAFDFAQPVFLELELTNRSGASLEIPEQLLDPKAGLLEILIRRHGDGNESHAFIPVMERCYDLVPGAGDMVPPGGSIRRNLNLTYGSAGFPFAEPGEYEVTALLPFFDRENQRELVVCSNVLRIRVGYPRSREEENDGLTLLREDVGLFFALGGSQALAEAGDALEEVRARRQGTAERITDPVVANIRRCQGIDAGRPYTRYKEGTFKKEEGDRVKAAALLEELGPDALRAFDHRTAEQTQELARKHRGASSK